MVRLAAGASANPLRGRITSQGLWLQDLGFLELGQQPRVVRASAGSLPGGARSWGLWLQGLGNPGMLVNWYLRLGPDFSGGQGCVLGQLLAPYGSRPAGRWDCVPVQLVAWLGLRHLSTGADKLT